MISEAKNKAVGVSPDEPKNVTITAASGIKNLYHFAGDGIYAAMSVEATTIEDATGIWKTKRVPLASTQPATPAQEPAIEPKSDE